MTIRSSHGTVFVEVGGLPLNAWSGMTSLRIERVHGERSCEMQVGRDGLECVPGAPSIRNYGEDCEDPRTWDVRDCERDPLDLRDDTVARATPGGAEVRPAYRIYFVNGDGTPGRVREVAHRVDCGPRVGFTDLDGDGSAGTAVDACDRDVRRPVLVESDCNDADPAIHPGATEICDGASVDEDCDGESDELDEVLYYDRDGDGYGSGPASLCTPIDQRVELGGDCNDGDITINPGRIDDECDNVDNNCDGAWDESAPDRESHLAYRDEDGDGFGVERDSIDLCNAGLAPPEGWVWPDERGFDCAPSEPSVNPAATEVCEAELDRQIDNDCDGSPFSSRVSGALTMVDYIQDADGDGFGAGATVASCAVACPHRADDPPGSCWIEAGGPLDCDDGDDGINPGQVDDTCDGIDQNCSCAGGSCDAPALEGADEDGDDLDVRRMYEDSDGDGYGGREEEMRHCPRAGQAVNNDDCNDDDGTIFPSAPESCDDPVNRDCSADGLGGGEATVVVSHVDTLGTTPRLLPSSCVNRADFDGTCRDDLLVVTAAISNDSGRVVAAGTTVRVVDTATGRVSTFALSGEGEHDYCVPAPSGTAGEVGAMRFELDWSYALGDETCAGGTIDVAAPGVVVGPGDGTERCDGIDSDCGEERETWMAGDALEGEWSDACSGETGGGAAVCVQTGATTYDCDVQVAPMISTPAVAAYYEGQDVDINGDDLAWRGLEPVVELNAGDGWESVTPATFSATHLRFAFSDARSGTVSVRVRVGELTSNTVMLESKNYAEGPWQRVPAPFLLRPEATCGGAVAQLSLDPVVGSTIEFLLNVTGGGWTMGRLAFNVGTDYRSCAYNCFEDYQCREGYRCNNPEGGFCVPAGLIGVDNTPCADSDLDVSNHARCGVAGDAVCIDGECASAATLGTGSAEALACNGSLATHSTRRGGFAFTPNCDGLITLTRDVTGPGDWVMRTRARDGRVVSEVWNAGFGHTLEYSSPHTMQVLVSEGDEIVVWTYALESSAGQIRGEVLRMRDGAVDPVAATFTVPGYAVAAECRIEAELEANVVTIRRLTADGTDTDWERTFSVSE